MGLPISKDFRGLWLTSLVKRLVLINWLVCFIHYVFFQSVLRKVESQHAPLISDAIMRALLQMFQSSVNNKTGGVQEDALMAVSTLVEVLGDGFAKYMEAFKPFLIVGLKNVAEYQVIKDWEHLQHVVLSTSFYDDINKVGISLK